jgi:hypothetical protein
LRPTDSAPRQGLRVLAGSGASQIGSATAASVESLPSMWGSVGAEDLDQLLLFLAEEAHQRHGTVVTRSPARVYQVYPGNVLCLREFRFRAIVLVALPRYLTHQQFLDTTSSYPRKSQRQEDGK